MKLHPSWELRVLLRSSARNIAFGRPDRDVQLASTWRPRSFRLAQFPRSPDGHEGDSDRSLRPFGIDE